MTLMCGIFNLKMTDFLATYYLQGLVLGLCSFLINTII